MKIYQVVPYYPPHVGGMESYVQHLSAELVSRGHEVTVFTSSNDATQSIRNSNGVKIYSLRISAKAYNVPIVPNLFLKLVEAEKPDLIHTHQYPVYYSDISALTSWLRKIPLLVHIHVVSDAKSVISGFISDMYYSTLGLRNLSSAKSIVVPSLAYKMKISQMHVNPNKIHVIPYGIDMRKFAGADGEEFRTRYECQESKVILTVGRLNYQKGFQYLIKAMPTVLKRIPKAKLIIVGEGEQLANLKQLTENLGLSGQVVFTGALSQQEMPNAYSACDLFVLPSLFESFGISLIEAQAAGKPVIGTRVGGVPEALIDGETGFLVEPNNYSALAASILYLLLNDDLSSKMGQKGKIFVEDKFELTKAVSDVCGAYQALTSSSYG